ncbi:hypothetical protein ACHQM5_028112 [Ranunculus cassubicifolius]
MAPEYATRGHFSVKSDVFSFGVLVLEIITGQKNSRYYESQGDKYLLSYVWKNFLEETASELLEAQLRENYCRTQVLRCIQIGLLCVQGDVAKRPMMASVVVMLNSNSVTLPSPSAPAFFVNSTVQFSTISEALDSSNSGSSMSTLHDQSISTSTDGSIAEVSASGFYPRWCSLHIVICYVLLLVLGWTEVLRNKFATCRKRKTFSDIPRLILGIKIYNYIELI